MKMVIAGLSLLLVFTSATTAYLFVQLRSVENSPDAIAQAEAQAVMEQVGRLIVLPTDEMPTIATVSDPELLKDQPFFANAKSGDRVLLFAKAKKAILYDPAADKIIEVAPINIGESSGAPIQPEVAGETVENPDASAEDTQP